MTLQVFFYFPISTFLFVQTHYTILWQNEVFVQHLYHRYSNNCRCLALTHVLQAIYKTTYTE